MSYPSKTQYRREVFSAKAADGFSAAYNVADTDTVTVQIAASTSPTLTIKAQGSNGVITGGASTAPDFTDSATEANPWSYVEIVDLNTGTAIDGSTGKAFSGAAGVFHYTINTDHLEWLSFELSGYTAGTASVNFTASNNS